MLHSGSEYHSKKTPSIISQIPNKFNDDERKPHLKKMWRLRGTHRSDIIQGGPKKVIQLMKTKP